MNLTEDKFNQFDNRHTLVEKNINEKCDELNDILESKAEASQIEILKARIGDLEKFLKK